MTSIKADLYQRLQETLLNSGAFENDPQLKAIFVDSRISPWLNQVPQATNPQARVQAVIEWLSGQARQDTAENGLVLLLQVLSDHKDQQDKLRHDLRDLAQELAITPLSENTPLYPTAALIPGTAPSVPSLFVGRDNDMAELRQRLGGQAETTLLTAVRGWPGIGKTSLAAAMAHDGELQKRFPDGVLWAALGTSPNVFAELGQWLTVLGDDPLQYMRPEERRNRLAALLRQRKMLLIVDDVWRAADAQPLLVGGKNCRTLITTREPEVARELGLPEQAIYRLLVLSEEHSIEIIRQLAPQAVAQDFAGVQRLVQELEGLPLALKVAGGLLAAEAAMGWGVSDLLAELAEGTSLLKEQAPADRMDLSNQTTPTIAALFKQSTDRLDQTTWERFALLGVFAPKPATFNTPVIAVAWNISDPKPTIRELCNRGLLEPSDGGRFQMHALLTVHAKSMWEGQTA